MWFYSVRGWQNCQSLDSRIGNLLFPFFFCQDESIDSFTLIPPPPPLVQRSLPVVLPSFRHSLSLSRSLALIPVARHPLRWTESFAGGPGPRVSREREEANLRNECDCCKIHQTIRVMLNAACLSVCLHAPSSGLIYMHAHLPGALDKRKVNRSNACRRRPPSLLSGFGDVSPARTGMMVSVNLTSFDTWA